MEASLWPLAPVELLLSACAVGLVLAALYLVADTVNYRRIPTLDVHIREDEKADVLAADQYVPNSNVAKDTIPCYDPATMQFLGHAHAFTPAQVQATIGEAKAAAQVWRNSSFKQRRLLLQVLLKYILTHQEDICRVSVRDSGKTQLEAVLGEIVVTAEKLTWLIADGEAALAPVTRRAGTMTFYKRQRLEYVPVGVVGAIVPWNWPFHNVINPISAAVFAGNAIIVKVSEYSSWSVAYWQRILDAALAAVGAPPRLVSFVTGYGDAGHVLVTGGVDTVIFVGSTEVGRKVMAAAAPRLTPLVLELGGKDPFIVCDDADLDQVVPIAVKAAFLNCGQNCAGGERFIVQRGVYDAYLSRVLAAVGEMVQGPSSCGGAPMDAGAMTMPGLAEKVAALVEDARAHGAQVLAGGQLGLKGRPGQFYTPTVLVGVTPAMRIWREEVFGPVMVVVPFTTDDEAVALANDCPFGLGSSVFTRSARRGRDIARRVEAGMVSVNDFNATYTCQGLPFGGVKDSGFGRFGGVEGLRSLCHMKSVAVDAAPWLMKTTIPPLLAHPVTAYSAPFARALTAMFYSPSVAGRVAGLWGVLSAVVGNARRTRDAGAAKKAS